MAEAIQCATCQNDMGTLALPTPAEIQDKLKGDWSPTAMMLKSALASLPPDSVVGVVKLLRFTCPVCAQALAQPQA